MNQFQSACQKGKGHISSCFLTFSTQPFFAWNSHCLFLFSQDLIHAQSVLHIYSFTWRPKTSACLSLHIFVHMHGYFGLLPKPSLYLCIHICRYLPRNAFETQMTWWLCVWLSPREPRWFSSSERSLHSSACSLLCGSCVKVIWVTQNQRVNQAIGNVMTQRCSHEVLHWPGTKAVSWGWRHFLCGNAWPAALHVPSLKGSRSLSVNPPSLQITFTKCDFFPSVRWHGSSQCQFYIRH